MGLSWPHTGSGAAPTLAYTISQISPVTSTLAAPNDAVTVPTMFLASYSGAMVSLSGTHSGLRVVFEGSTYDAPSVWRTWPAWHMQQGIWVAWDHVPTNGATAYWMPSNGAVNVRMRCTNIATGSAAGGAIAMHAPASIGTGPVGKWDWAAHVQEVTPGNNTIVMVPFTTVVGTALVARTSTLNASSWTIPAPKRLRLHSYAGGFLAGADGGKCKVDLRSNLAGATTTGSDLLGTWIFGPSAGGTNANERWSGLASALTEPIDIYNNGGGASLGFCATGSPNTSGKLTFSLFGYLVG